MSLTVVLLSGKDSSSSCRAIAVSLITIAYLFSLCIYLLWLGCSISCWGWLWFIWYDKWTIEADVFRVFGKFIVLISGLGLNRALSHWVPFYLASTDFDSVSQCYYSTWLYQPLLMYEIKAMQSSYHYSITPSIAWLYSVVITCTFGTISRALLPVIISRHISVILASSRSHSAAYRQFATRSSCRKGSSLQILGWRSHPNWWARRDCVATPP